MAGKFTEGYGDWTQYRKLPDIQEVDLHLSGNGYHDYYESMDAAYAGAIDSVRKAQEEGKKYVLFTHGHSTSRLGKTTARSKVREAMRGKEATPFIIRRKCIQHDSVFVAAIKPLSPAGTSRKSDRALPEDDLA